MHNAGFYDITKEAFKIVPKKNFIHTLVKNIFGA